MLLNNFMLLGLVLATPGDKPSEMPQLQLQPSRCVTLQQGRLCHAQVQIRWQTSEPINACLYQQQERLMCWRNTQQAQWRWDFAYASSQSLQLWQVDQRDNIVQIIASSQLEVNWVHQAQKKRIWRRF